jgi:hypothetical protein
MATDPSVPPASQCGGPGGHAGEETPQLQTPPLHQHAAPHLCERCARDLTARNEWLGDRVDLWTTASNLLGNREWGDNEVIGPGDIIDLAMFLGEEIRGD